MVFIVLDMLFFPDINLSNIVLFVDVVLDLLLDFFLVLLLDLLLDFLLVLLLDFLLNLLLDFLFIVPRILLFEIMFFLSDDFFSNEKLIPVITYSMSVFLLEKYFKTLFLLRLLYPSKCRL